MPPPTDYTYRGSVALRFLGIIIIGTAAALVFFPADLQPIIVRVGLAGGLGLGVLHLSGRLIDAARGDGASAFTRALTPPPVPLHPEPTLMQLRNEVGHSRMSRRYFDKVLWPRLAELAAKRGIAMPAKPAPPAFPLRNGPDLAAIAALVDRLEKRQ